MSINRKILLSLFFLIQGLYSSGQSQLDTAFNFTVKDIYGNNIELFQLLDQGKYVVMDFFSPACGFCQLYAGDMQEAYLAHGENQGNVHFMGIGWGASIDNILDFMSQYGLTYPMVSGSQGGGNQLLLDFKIISYPTIILIRPDRVISGELYIPYHPPTVANIDSIIAASGAPFVGLSDDFSGNVIKPEIHPNPFTDHFEVSFYLNDPTLVSFEISDLQGRIIYLQRNSLFNSGKITQKIEVGSNLTGMYVLKIYVEGQRPFSNKLFAK